MKHLTHWILALVAITTVASFSGAWTTVPQAQKVDHKVAPPAQGKKGAGNQAAKQAARQAAILKVMPTLKVSVAEAITLAEKEAGGKAFAAGVEILAGKPSIHVDMFVNDKVTAASVDTETKKVTIAGKKPDEGGESGEEEGEEEGG